MSEEERSHRDAQPVSPTGLRPLTHYLEIGEARGIMWTSLRRHVLELLWTTPTPQGAYGLADKMRTGGSNIYPNSLYRVLSILDEARLVVPIARGRRFQISPDPDQRDWAVLQCLECGRTELVLFTPQADLIREAARRHGHAAKQLAIESLGLCRLCEVRGDAPPAVRRGYAGAAAIA